MARQQRQLVKALLENNNISDAVTRLSFAVTEHDNYINSRNISGENFTINDNLSLHHAQDHMDFVQNPIQKQAVIDALAEVY